MDTYLDRYQVPNSNQDQRNPVITSTTVRSRPHGHQYKMALTTPLSPLLMVSTLRRQGIVPLPEPCLSRGVNWLIVGSQSQWCTSPTVFSQPIKGKGFLLSGSPLLKLIIYLSRCIKAVLQKDPSGLRAFCWRDGSVGHLVAGIPGN